MKEIIVWIFAALTVSLSEALSPASNSGTNQSTYVNSTDVIRNVTFNLGNDVNLTCGNRSWNDSLFVIWNMQLKSKSCKIAFILPSEPHDQNQNSCDDGKSLRNTSRAQSYLSIPNFSTDDVGVYKCELTYKGGSEGYVISVAITVPPMTSAWLERRANKTVAVCRAARGKPAANISWSHGGQALTAEVLESDGFVTVQSSLELSEGVDAENLTCAVRHPSWLKEKILEPKPLRGSLFWPLVLAGVLVSVLLVGLVIFAQWKWITSRQRQRSDTSPFKYPPAEDAEEEEPYASYVQRVNSIYN